MSQTQVPQDYPTIVILDGEKAKQRWVLRQEVTSLGRDDSCDIVIPNRQISRQHVRFKRLAADHYVIEDLASKNGTWLNGHRLEGEHKLSDGDEIQIALVVKLRFADSDITASMTDNLPDVIPSDHVEGPTLYRRPSGRMHIDTEARRVFIQGEELEPALSLPQYRLLSLLYENAGRVCTREEVVRTVWPDVVGDGVSEQAIDALVRRLRDRLHEADPEWQYVVTVRGHGFRLDNPEN